MNDKLVATKAAIAAFFTAVGTFLGWKGIMAIVWVTAMALDYISGTAAACKAGAWCSATARQGLWHKGGMIIVVIVALIADAVMLLIGSHLPLGLTWPGIILPLVLAWYIITELGSILENAVKLGAAVPTWLTKLLKASLQAVDKAGEAMPEQTSKK
jgi:toxin secretion/phage lysis holin